MVDDINKVEFKKLTEECISYEARDSFIGDEPEMRVHIKRVGDGSQR
jgi:hypothetical protein